MPLTSEILKEHFDNLRIIVIMQNDLIREALITNEFQKPLLFALTICPDLKTQSSIDIWKMIKNDLFIGETIQSMGYSISKINFSHEKAQNPDWLKNLTGSTNLIYDAYSYDLVIQRSVSDFFKFATIIEIVLDKSLNQLIKYKAEKNVRTVELNKLINRIYQLSKIKKEPIVFV
jgi:hypothetical protein